MWHPQSWRDKPCAQAIDYPDLRALDAAQRSLQARPALVTPAEIAALKRQLQAAERGERWVLQTGDCAESFEDCSAAKIAGKVTFLSELADRLRQPLELPITRLGRIAGQYAKPRSEARERRGHVSLPSYFGDLINGPDFTLAARTPDPARMLRGHACAEEAMAALRAHSSPYSPSQPQDPCFCSHEGLNLHYESALTRAHAGAWLDLSTHLLWIGDRTRQLEGAHVEFFSGVDNPIGVKLGPSITPEELLALSRRLNPQNQEGKLVWITRLGADRVEALLPPLIDVMARHRRRGLFLCDPMHGNTTLAASGKKTRALEAILGELRATMQIHRALGSSLGGVHLELTHEAVQECVDSESTGDRYTSRCDPRLNRHQALRLLDEIARTHGRLQQENQPPASDDLGRGELVR